MTLAASQVVPPRHAAILIVDDDLGTCETFHRVLKTDGYRVETAMSGAEALKKIGAQNFDLLLLDLQLPDMQGTDVARTMRRRTTVPFILMSAFLTTEVTVEAMRIGAANVIEKPIWTDELRATVALCFCESAAAAADTPVTPSARMLQAPNGLIPGSTAERWACYVAKACQSPRDFPSTGQWAASVGASATTVVQTCRQLNIRTRDARDLARLLRALVHSKPHRCPPEALMLVSDSRTLDRLFDRGGLKRGIDRWCISLDDFLVRQRFVATDNEGCKALRRLLRASTATTVRGALPLNVVDDRAPAGRISAKG
jgi:DNA-binding response OmpR family regulator